MRAYPFRMIRYIVTPQFELEASLKQERLSLTLFDFADQMFYHGEVTNATLPDLIASLYENIQHFFLYITTNPQPQACMRLQQSKLYIKDYICNAQEEVQSQFPLNLVDVAGRIALLKKKIMREGVEIKQWMDRWTKQTAIMRQNKDFIKVLNEEIMEKTAEEIKIIQRIRLLKERKYELQGQIDYQKMKLANTNQQINQFYRCQNIKIPEAVRKVFGFIPYEENPFFQFFTRTDNLILNNIDQHLFYSQLVAANAIPNYAHWMIAFRVIACKYGLAIGLTAEENRHKQHSFSQGNAISLCTRNNSLYLNGICTPCEEIALKNGDLLQMEINRKDSALKFFKNGVQIQDIVLPSRMSGMRLYPFIELSHRDTIQLMFE